MPIYETDIEGNDRTIHITSSDLSWEKPYGKEEENLYFHYDADTSLPSTILNLQDTAYRMAVLPEGTFDYVFNNNYTSGGNEKPQSYYGTDEYKYNLDLVNKYTYWIWGNSENCGLVLYRKSAKVWTLSLIQGFYQSNVAEDSYIYNLASVDLTYDNLKAVMFTCDSESMRTALANGYIDLEYIVNTTDEYYVYKWDYLAGYVPYGQLPTPNFNYCYEQNGTWHDLMDITNPRPEYIVNPSKPARLVDVNFNLGTHTKIGGDGYGSAQIEVSNPFINADFNNSEAGGFGLYPTQSDDIGFTDADNLTIDAVTSGFLTLYNPTASEVKSFNNFLLSGLTDSVADNLKKLQASPMEFLIFIAQCHFSPPTSVIEQISFAGVGSGVNSKVVSKQYYTLDCGTINIPEASQTFLDYEASKVSIYLPYAGIKELNVQDVTKSSVHVKYQINMLTGDCLIQVRVDRNARRHGDTDVNAILYHFTGNVYTTLPISATDWRGAISAGLSLITAGASAMQGNAGGAVGGIVDAVVSKKVAVNRAGSTSSSFGYMDNQKPYLILERVIPNIPTDYGKGNGYTTNMNKQISNLRGYTEIEGDSLRINDFKGITQEEFDMLKDICNGGIIL